MEEPAAYSIRNDLDEVRSMGIEVGGKPGSGEFQDFEIKEFDLALLRIFWPSSARTSMSM